MVNEMVAIASGLKLHRYAQINPHQFAGANCIDADYIDTKCADAKDCGPWVLLHGWGGDSRTWQPLIPHLQQLGEVIAIDLPGFGGSDVLSEFTHQALLSLLEAHLPVNATLMGWSLGGMLAVALAERAPHKVARVITLAANVKFVASSDYSAAMPLAINQKFNQDFIEDAFGSVKRFCGLMARGDQQERALLKSLRELFTASHPNVNWQNALTLLAQMDNRTAFSQLKQPGLHIFGEMDALVPMAAANHLRELNPQQHVEVILQTSHAFHWSQPEKTMQLIHNFLCSERNVDNRFEKTFDKEKPVQNKWLDKRKVAHSFSRAAATYDSVAGLQRDVGARLLTKLPAVHTEGLVLDVGCGTGFYSQHLAQCFPAAQLIGLDIAQGMLTFAREQQTQAIHWLCGDAEYLPVKTDSVDLIFSSLALQWCENFAQVFAEAHRVLKPGGRFVFSTLGPDTLHELKNAWQAVDAYVHVNRFHSVRDLGNALASAGFTVEQWQEEKRVLQYRHLAELTRELKALGAHNINYGQSSGLTGRRKIEALKNAYEVFRHDNFLPATYEVFYVVARVKESINA